MSDTEMAPTSHDSPSRSVGGTAPMAVVPPVPTSPSGERHDTDDQPQDTGAPQGIADIFGADDDDDVDGGASAPGRQIDAEQEEEDDEDDEDSEERRRRRRRREALEEEEAESQQRRKKSRRADRPADEQPQEEDNGLPQMSEQELKRAMLDAQIEAAVKSGKKKVKRRKKGDEEDLDPQADAEVADLRSQMMNAADDDIIANEERRPALAKLRMLPKVVDGLQKSHWQQSIFDSNLLEAVRRFLEPLPDKSLPALNIQRELFAALEKLSPAIDTISLKMSGLGKVIMFYSRNKRVEGDLRRRADRLIETWSRPILKRSASYRAMDIRKAAYTSSQSQPLAPLADSQPDPNRRNVSIPQPIMGGYKIAPRSLLDSAMNAGGDGGAGGGAAGGAGGDERFRAAAASRERLNAFKRKVKDARR